MRRRQALPAARIQPLALLPRQRFPLYHRGNSNAVTSAHISRFLFQLGNGHFGPTRRRVMFIIFSHLRAQFWVAGYWNERMIRSYQGTSPTIPETCYVDQSAQIIGDVQLGEHSSVWMNAVVRGDVNFIRVGHYSNIQDCSVLHGMKAKHPVVVGDYVTVGHSVTLHGCTIEDRCLIGMGCIILNGAHVGSGCIIAAGTLIPEGTILEPNSLWMGSPGKFRRHLDKKDEEMILMYAENYIGYKKQYLGE